MIPHPRRALGALATAALLVLGRPLAAQQPVDSEARADSIREDSIFQARLHRLFRKGADSSAPAPVAAPPPAPVVAPAPAPAPAPKPSVDTVKPPPAPPAAVAPVAPTPAPKPTAAPAPTAAPSPPVHAEAPKARPDTTARVRADTVKPAPVPKPAAAPAPAPAPAPVAAPTPTPVRPSIPTVTVDTGARARVDTARPAPAPAVPAPVAPAPTPAPAVAPAPAQAAPAPAPARSARETAEEIDREKLDSIVLRRWGEVVWKNRQCQGCHELGRDQATGPNLLGVTDRRPPAWLRSWLKNPITWAQEDPAAAELKKKYGSQMPNLHLSDHDIDGLLAYLAQETVVRAGH